MSRLVHVRPLDPTVVHHPAVVHEFNRRAADVQLRIADRIIAFAGSMRFVYLHAVLFVVWMLVFEASPWPTLTLIVSLEAIFLSTFVMIGQNRQASFQQAYSTLPSQNPPWAAVGCGDGAADLRARERVRDHVHLAGAAAFEPR